MKYSFGIPIFNPFISLFKLAVKYMKTVNEVEGRHYAEEYVREMLKVLEK